MAKIQAVARHIARIKDDYEGMVIVASAMVASTDKLIAMAKEAGGGEIPKRELDVLLATGEQQTVALLAIALQNLGVDAQSMTGFHNGFIASRYNNVEIGAINTEKVEEIVKSGKVAVVAGFQGVNEDGDITTLGSGGSDITAVGIAAHLGWDCEIYTTTDCLYTVDPKMYSEAKPVRAITYEEMMEIANLGADKIETRAVELAKKFNVKLYLGKTSETDKSKGTYIMSREMIINENLMVEDMPITGVGTQDDVAIFTLRNVPADGKAVAECFAVLGELGINVDMISQQMAENGTCTVSFSCSAEQGEALMSELEGREVFADIQMSCEGNLAMISLVGVGMATHSGVASKVFQVLAENSIRYYHITTSEISISVTVDMEQKMQAVIALAREFNL